MGQWWHDLQTWEWFLNEHPISTFIEIGSWEGGMTLFFIFQCRARQIKFQSFDIVPHYMVIQNSPWLWEIAKPHLRSGDVWDDAGRWIQAQFVEPRRGPILLFCDGGDKPREVRTFGPLLREGDFLAVHDWCETTEGGEIHPNDIDRDVLSMVYEEICLRHDNHTRFFTKRQA